MSKPKRVRPPRTLFLGAAFAVVALPAFAQGTAAQREACTPDAVKLCSDTIPDIPKTTACMARHRAELSPKCRAVMPNEGAPTRAADAPPTTRKRAAREVDEPDADHPRDLDPPRRRLAREPRREDDGGARWRRDDAGPPEGPDGPDERRAARDDGPGRYGYGPRGEDGGPPDEPAYGRRDAWSRGYGPGDDGPPDDRRADRDDGPPPGYVPPGARRYRYLTPDGEPAVTPEGGGRARARAEIGRLCADDMIDPRTCAETQRALRR